MGLLWWWFGSRDEGTKSSPVSIEPKPPDPVVEACRASPAPANLPSDAPINAPCPSTIPDRVATLLNTSATKPRRSLPSTRPGVLDTKAQSDSAVVLHSQPEPSASLPAAVSTAATPVAQVPQPQPKCEKQPLLAPIATGASIPLASVPTKSACSALPVGMATRTHTPFLVTQAKLACLRQLISFTLVARPRIEQTLFVRGRNRAISSYRRTAAWRLPKLAAKLAAKLASRRSQRAASYTKNVRETLRCVAHVSRG